MKDLTYNLPYVSYRSGDVESLWGYSGINESPHGVEKAKEGSIF